MGQGVQAAPAKGRQPGKPAGGHRQVSKNRARVAPRGADPDEHTRRQAQRKAYASAGHPGTLMYAVRQGQRPPAAIETDKRWRKTGQSVTVGHATTGEATRFDLWEALITVNLGAVIAEGVQAWEMLSTMVGEFQEMTISSGNLLGGVVRPWDRFPRGKHTIIYLTTRYGYVLYFDTEFNAIREVSHREFIDTITWGAVAKAGKSAEGLLPLYDAMIFVALWTVVPGGKLMERAAKAASLMVFWDKHADRINACLELGRSVLMSLRVIYRRSPRLGAAMLRLAMGEASLKIQEAVQKDGLVKAVVSNLDQKKFMRYVAEFFATVLKFKMGKLSGVASKLLGKAGLTTLAQVAGLISQWRKITRAASNVASGGGIKDPQNLATAFLKLVADAGVQLTQSEAEGIIAEQGYLDADVLKAVDALARDCTELERAVKDLSDRAEKELF